MEPHDIASLSSRFRSLLAPPLLGSAPGLTGSTQGLAYREIWRGVDLVFWGVEGRLEYGFLVGPCAYPSRIRLAYDGVEGIGLSDDGRLLVHAALGDLYDEAPRTYQERDGAFVPVSSRFRLDGGAGFGFEIGPHDRMRPLVIDPSLVYSTYLGGSYGEAASFHPIAVDSTGHAYVSGATLSLDFPTASPLQATNVGGSDAFVAKLNRQGGGLQYSTYIGGFDDDSSRAIAVDSTGAVYLVGNTRSTDFPLVHPYQNNLAGASDAFVAKLAPTGSTLAYSLVIGGTSDDHGQSVAVNATGKAVLAGTTLSTDYPVFLATQASRRGPSDAFVTRVEPEGWSLVFSTYLGGSGEETGRGVDVGDQDPGDVYVTGTTTSTDFPLLDAYQSVLRGESDAFVAKLAGAGSFFYLGTYLGGSNWDTASDIAIGPYGADRVFVVGSTQSTDFPTRIPFQPTHAGGQSDTFVTGLGTHSLFYSTYLGGDGDETGWSVALDPSNAAYVSGETNSEIFPLKSAYQSGVRGGTDAFLTKFSPAGWYLGYSTLVSGSGDDSGWGVALDSSGAAYVAGDTWSLDFPVKGPYQGTNAGHTDAFVTKFPGRGVRKGSADLNGDHQADIGVFRNGTWFVNYSDLYAGVSQVLNFGSPTPGMDTPDLGELGTGTGSCELPDGQTDFVILRKAFSTWQASRSPSWSSTPGITVTFGTTAHKRLPTRFLDTNGDGCSDLGVFRNGCFDVLESPGYVPPATHVCFGLGTDTPLAADLTGDGKSELILWRAATAHYEYRIAPGFTGGSSADLGAGDYPLVADMDWDGELDLGSYKQATSTFRFTYSPDFWQVDLIKTQGVNGDIPVLADVNGDGIADIGIFRNAIARWWFLCSPNWTGTCLSQSFGVAGDVPIFGRPPGMP